MMPCVAANSSPPEIWPALPLEGWKDTYSTLHLWSQIAGKVALALAPPINHSWGIAFQITPRGLVTRSLPYGRRTFVMEFDFVGHQFNIRTSDGDVRAMPLAPQSVADFYREVMRALSELELPVKIWPVAVELPELIRLDQDTVHHSYDPVWARRFWDVVLQVARVFEGERCDFIGKCSPVHFFWGSFDLAVTRFSGRPAPPREGPVFMQEAYSQEVISHGFWPGGPTLPEPVFYAYAVPEPAGLKEAKVQPPQTYYHRELGEFILPYEAVRTDHDPDATLRSFVESTYERAATLGHWDRAHLERKAG
jgi:hypothetical protein